MFGLDTTPLTTRLLKTRYDSYDCNTLMLLINTRNTTMEEVEIIKQYNEKDTVLVDINVEERTIKFEDQEIDLERLIKQCEGMCSGINSDHLREQMESCRIVFLLFARQLPKMALRDPKVIEKMCGLLLLEPKKDYLYISIICANRGKGGVMLSFAEQVAEKLHYNKVKLSSLDTPFPFYIKNNYRIDNGASELIIAEDDDEEVLHIRGDEYYMAPSKEDLVKNYMKPYTGIVYSKNGKHWIYVGDSERYEREKWFYIKPGYVILYNRIQDGDRVYFERNPIFRGNDIAFEYFLSKSHNITKFRVENKDGNKLLLNGNAGVINHLINVSVKSKDFIQMTKDLNVYPVTRIAGKKYKRKKRTRKYRPRRSTRKSTRRSTRRSKHRLSSKKL